MSLLVESGQASTNVLHGKHLINFSSSLSSQLSTSVNSTMVMMSKTQEDKVVILPASVGTIGCDMCFIHWTLNFVGFMV